MPDLVILHTNDLHGKLTDRGAEIISRQRAEDDPCLLVDCGDAISSGNIYYRPGGEPMLRKLSDLGYDAMVMGNREFHFLSAGLHSKVKLARFPVLCSNLRSKNGELDSSICDRIVLTKGGLKVGLFGLTVPMITKKMRFATSVSPYWFDDPIEAAAMVVDKLKGDADLVIALTHIGLKKDQELAASVSGIDLVVGGHTHAVLSEPQWVGSTAIVQAGWWGHYLGRVEITMGQDHPEIRGSLIDLR